MLLYIDGTVRTYDIRAGILQCDDLKDPITCVRCTHDQKCVLSMCLGSQGNSAARLTEISTGNVF